MKRIRFRLKQTQTLYGMFRLIEETVNFFLFKIAGLYRRQLLVTNQKQRILISKLDAIGDFVIFSASLPIYKKLFPDAQLVLLVRSDVYNLAEYCPYVDEVWSINQRLFRRNLREHIRWFVILSTGRFDVAINAVYSANYDFFDCLVGWTFAPRRIGFECKDVRTRRYSSSKYYTEYVCDESIGPLFEMDRNTTMLAHLGYLLQPISQTIIWMTQEDRTSTSILLRQHRVSKYAVVFPGARDSYRSWGVTKFTDLAHCISSKLNLTFILAGGPDDMIICNALERELREIEITCHNFSGKTTLRQLACLIDAAEFCISSETSAAHIAAAVSTPCLCIIGGGHYGRFYPYPDNPLTQAITNQLPCFGCNWVCSRNQVECVSGITVETAVSSLLSLLSRPIKTSHYNR